MPSDEETPEEEETVPPNEEKNSPPEEVIENDPEEDQNPLPEEPPEVPKNTIDSDFDGITDDRDLCPNNYNPRQEINACSCTSTNSLVLIADTKEDESERLQEYINRIISDETLDCLLLEGTFKIQKGITMSGNILIDGQEKTALINNSDTSL